MNDPLLTSDEVLALIPVSYPTLLRYVRAGQLAPARLIGRQVVWRASEVEAFINSLPRQAMEPQEGRGRPRAVAAA